MLFISTRNKEVQVSGAEAIVKGLSDDGGLFVPIEIPTITSSEMQELMTLSYAEKAAFVMSKFLTDFTKEELLECANFAYSKFECENGDTIPIMKVDNNFFVLELWHGPTLAFKDVALTILPKLLVLSKKKLGITTETKILVATSGDTGKAALEGFKDIEGTSITVFYPSDGVSSMQKLQMQTQEGDNVKVFAVKGNFDDCQSAVKGIFANEKIVEELREKNIELSSANSINFGRLLPQIVYYVSSYCDMVSAGEIAMGDEINYCVPTGNFGNILAGYYAKQMGIPIKKLICASNQNNILTDFFRAGNYDIRREFFKTLSPSMDILISSNLERLLFESSGRNDKLIAQRMASLKTEGKYCISPSELSKMTDFIFADYASEDETLETMQDVFDNFQYVLDPHTAVAVAVKQKYERKKNDTATKCLILSTANPYKFPQDVYYAITGSDVKDSFRAIKLLKEESAMPIPNSIMALKTKPKLHSETVHKDKLSEKI